MFGPSVDREILEAAKASDEEICGVIVDGKPVFLKNEAEDPKNEFYIRSIPENSQAVFHSHPDGPFYPSLSDMRQQVAMDIPWGIAAYTQRHAEVFWFGEGAPKPPLVGRGFRHGVSDCYGLIEDFYAQVHDIKLPPYPRTWEWWAEGGSLYADHFEEAGFHEIGLDEILPGDSFLATIRAKTPNHAGVYIGNGLILHHTCGRDGYDPFRLSVIEPAARWFNFLTKVVRHENDKIDRKVGQRIW